SPTRKRNSRKKVKVEAISATTPRKKRSPKKAKQTASEPPPLPPVPPLPGHDDNIIDGGGTKSPTRGRSRSKPSLEVDEVISTTKKKSRSPPKKKRVGPKKAKQKSDGDTTQKKQKNEKEDETNELLACPHCEKGFSSKWGLKYHLNKKVCQQTEPKHEERDFICPHCEKTFSSEKRLTNHLDKKVCRRQSSGEISKKESKVENSAPLTRRTPKRSVKVDPDYTEDVGVEIDDDLDGGTTKKKGKKRKRESDGGDGRVADKFHQLEPGLKFSTRFGVVEVIADNRLPSDHIQATIDRKKMANASRCFDKRREKNLEKELLVRDQIAVGTRHRREELKKIYLQTAGTSTGTPTTQKEVWDLYCASISPKEILTEGLSWALCNNADLMKRNKIDTVDLRDDPRFPKDRYPDRIVECKLVEDERDTVFGRLHGGLDNVTPDDESSNRVEFHKTEIQKQSVPIMRLFIARRELTQVYGSSSPNYICSYCGKSYQYNRTGLNYHLSQRTCLALKGVEKEKREQRIEAVEIKALSGGSSCRGALLTNVHGVIKTSEGPVRDEPPDFGNPHKIKEFKKHKMPPWLVFNAQRSSMYPEIYASLEFRRGSQNRNYFNKIKQEDGYISRTEKSRLRKRLRMSNPGAKPLSVASAGKTLKEAKKKPKTEEALHLDLPSMPAHASPVEKDLSKQDKKKSSVTKTEETLNLDLTSLPGQAAAKKKSSKRKAKKKFAAKTDKSLDSGQSFMPPDLPPLPPISDTTANVDFAPNEGNDGPIFDTPSDTMPLDGVTNDLIVGKETNNEKKMTSGASLSDDNSRRRKRVMVVSKKKNSVVIDAQVLVTECESGRYPTINRFYGDHEKQCTLCKKTDAPMMYCDFCKNSVHQLCIDKRMLGKDPPILIQHVPSDDGNNSSSDQPPICHECISIALFRRSRAESRRVMKWQHELSKAGLENAPEAASLPEEVNLKGSEGTICNSGGETGGEDKPTYKPCPDGGPGGLICCSYCTAAYSRSLSNTAKEIEAQSVARVGQEVSEIMELLADAKLRLQRAADLSQSNEERRGLLDKNQSAHA
ncbi:hypothetical protein ACHAXR_006965, partial [Thalassiosira sp. AJA248-18]